MSLSLLLVIISAKMVFLSGKKIWLVPRKYGDQEF
jgi:hypothetical protein